MANEVLDGFGGLAGMGILMAGLGFGWAQFKSGAGKAKDDSIASYKEALAAEQVRIEQLKAENKQLIEDKNTLMKSHQDQINALTEKIGKLQGLYEASELRNKQNLAILQGRNPEQQKFMEFMTENAKQNGEILLEIKRFMTSINDKIDRENRLIEKKL